MPETTALDIEQIVDQLFHMADLPRDHLVGVRRRFALFLRQLKHADGVADGAERRAQFVAEHREEIVFRAAVVLGSIAIPVGLEELGEIGHDQIQAAAVGRNSGGQGESHFKGTRVRADEAATLSAAAGLEERLESGPVGWIHEPFDPARHHGLERLAHQRREAGVASPRISP